MEAESRKHVLRMITYGLYVLTAAEGDEVAAATVTWLAQASFNPPLVMAAVKVDSHTHALVEKSGQFAVNILASGQKELAAAFFRPSVVEGGKLNGLAFEPGPQTGAPLLTDLPAWFEARVVQAVKGGDHTVYVAEVINAGVRDRNARPLALSETGWSYGG